jgi:hypothetical protein
MRLLVLIAVLCAGCAGRQLRVDRIAPSPIPQPVVWIRGDVKNPAILWSEELTLTGAIVAAEYKGLADPHLIMIVRQGQTYKVKPRDLLKGLDDQPLEPGDTVIIER